MPDIFHDTKIVFPIRLGRSGDSRISYIYSNWRNLKEPVSVQNCDNFAILTGRQNGITVVQLHYIQLGQLGVEDTGTIRIHSPDGYVFLIFEYEPKIDTIYKLNFNVSLFNDNSFVIGGLKYSVQNKEIQKMPIELLEIILSEQSKYDNHITKSLYDLLMLLPDKWFHDQLKVPNLIFALQNSKYCDADWIPTLHKVLFERWDYFNEPDFLSLLKRREKMSTIQKRVTFFSVHKDIRDLNEDGYNLWKKQYVSKGKRRLVFKEDYAIPYNMAKEIFGKAKVKPDKLTKLDNRIVIVRRDICKSCLKLFKVNCCRRHNRDNRSARMFIMNADIV